MTPDMSLDGIQLLIARVEQPAAGGRVFERSNPPTRKIVTRAATATAADARWRQGE